MFGRKSTVNIVLIKKKRRNWLLENFQKNRDFSMSFYSFNTRARLGPCGAQRLVSGPHWGPGINGPVLAKKEK
jgi:hypothetical protein